MTNPDPATVVEQLWPAEVAGMRKRVGTAHTKAVLRDVAAALLAAVPSGGTVKFEGIHVDWAQIERESKSCLACAMEKAVTRGVIGKSASQTAPALAPASLELRFAPEDRNAILAALAALRPAAKLSITQADGSVTTLERETGLVTSSRTSPGPKAEPPHSSASDQTFWDSQQHGGSGSPQPYDGSFWDRQDAGRRRPPALSTPGATRAGRLPPA